MVANLLNIEELLKLAGQFYRRRMLEKAFSTAREALHLSEEEDFAEGMKEAHLLLGKINSTAGHYQGDAAAFEQALVHLQQATQLQNKHQTQPLFDLELSLIYGRVFQYQKAYDQARKHLNEALAAIDQEDWAAKVRLYCALSQLYISQNHFDQALEITTRAEELIKEKEIGQEKLHIEVDHQLAQIFIKKRQQYAKILSYSEKVLTYSKKEGDLEKELKALNNIAIVHGVQSNYKQAMQYFLEELDKSKLIRNHSNIAQCLFNIGTIYAQLYNHKDAIIRYEKVLSEYDHLVNDSTRVIVYNNLGNIYYNTERLEQAELYFGKALDLAERSNYREMVAQSLAQLSRTKAARKDFANALVDANKAQELLQNLGEVNGKQINLINLGNIHYQNDELDMAMRLTSQGIVAAKRMGDAVNEIRGYQLLSNIYQKKKDFEKALNYQLIYSKTQENFANERRNRQIIDLEIKNAITEKQKEIEQLTKENEYQALLLKQSDQIAQQNAQLLAANDELRQFAYVASHDLKEPLRMIGSYIQLIYRQHAEQFTEESKVYFDFVSEGAVRMNNLLDALLRYATVGKTEEEREEVDLKDVVDIAIINLRVSIEETGAVIDCQDLPIVYSTQSLLTQLFQNLLSNAIKFRVPQKSPSITISAEDHPEETIISIKDEGIGIAPEYQDRIFVIFQRLHARTKYKGTGIGLAICQKIMQRLGGRIWVESEANKGANFFISIPKVSGTF
ncbi:MAG: ATP-binding protein [Bacteroidota bacterium]